MSKKHWEYAAVITVGVFVLVTPEEVWVSYGFAAGLKILAVFGICWAFMCLVWDQIY